MGWLSDMAPSFATALEQGLLEAVPPEQAANVRRVSRLLTTQEGRQTLASEIRETESNPSLPDLIAQEATEPARDLVVEKYLPSEEEGSENHGNLRLDTTVGPLGSSGPAEEETPDINDESSFLGGNDDPCPAVGDLADPGIPGKTGGIGGLSILSPKGAFASLAWETHAGTFETALGTDGKPYLKVVALIKDPKKGFPIGALNVRVNVKPLLGKHESYEFDSSNPLPKAPPGGGNYCFTENDSTRGYAVVWIPLEHEQIKLSEPGFLLHAELTERDYWFRAFGPHWDLGLAGVGPAYWAAADQEAVHIAGRSPQVDRSPIDGAVGAFLDRGRLVDEDENPDNDTERFLLNAANSAAAQRIDQMTGSFIDSALSPLFIAYLHDIDLNGSLLQDLTYVERMQEGLPDGVSPDTHALRFSSEIDSATVSMSLSLPFNIRRCEGSAAVDANTTADLWFDELDGSSTMEIRSHGDVTSAEVHTHSLKMPWYNWIRNACTIAWGAAMFLAPVALETLVSTTLESLLNTDDGQGAKGPLTELLTGLDLQGRLGGLYLPGDIHVNARSWRDSCVSDTCPFDESFLQSRGLDLLLDGNTAAESNDGLLEWGDPWKAVYRPPATATVPDLIRSHSDAEGGLRDAGFVVTGDLMNSVLHDLGTSSLLKIMGNMSVIPNGFPEIKFENLIGYPQEPPIFLGSGGLPGEQPHSEDGRLRFILPNYVLGGSWASPGLGGQFKFAVTLAVEVDPVDIAAGGEPPTIGVVANPDIEALDCVGADYVNFYALSYGLCGTENAGGSGWATLPQVLNGVVSLLADRFISSAFSSLVKSNPVTAVSKLIQDAGVFGFATVLNTKVTDRGGNVAVYFDIGLPSVEQSPPLLQLESLEEEHFTWMITPSNFPGSGPYLVEWKVEDLVGGVVLDSQDCADDLECYIPGDQFEITKVGTKTQRRARVTVTVERAGVSRKKSQTITWTL